MRTTFAPLPGRNGRAIPRSARFAGVFVVLAASVAAGGCTHVGPKSVTVDRFDYAAAIGESWKQQTLLNIVKLRYMDLPVFLDVSSIVAGYSMETSGNVGGAALLGERDPAATACRSGRRGSSRIARPSPTCL